MKLRSWLRRMPPAHSARCATSEGEKTVKIDHQDPRRWARAEESIIALAPSRVEALDKDGDVLRVVELNVEEQPDADEDEERVEGSAGEDRKLAQLAKLINEAHDNAAKRHENAYRTGFDILAELCKQSVGAQLSMAKALEGVMRKVSASAPAPAEESPEDVPAMLMQGLMMRQLGMGGAGAGGMNVPPEVVAMFKAAMAQQQQPAKTNGTHAPATAAPPAAKEPAKEAPRKEK